MLNLEVDLYSKIIMITTGVIGLTAYIPQIYRLIKTKSSDDIHPLSWVGWLTIYTLMVVYSFVYTADILLFATYVSDLLFCIITFVLTLKYRSKKE